MRYRWEEWHRVVPNSTPRMDGHQDTTKPRLDTNLTTNLTKTPTRATGKERRRTSVRSKPTWRARTRRTHRTTNLAMHHHPIGSNSNMLPKPNQAQEAMVCHHKNLGACLTTGRDTGVTTLDTRAAQSMAARDSSMNHYPQDHHPYP